MPKSMDKECYRRYKEFKENSNCFSCGADHTVGLQFHHFDPSNKFMAVSNMVRQGWDWNEVKDEINKCVTVCEPCHQRIHTNAKHFNARGMTNEGPRY